MIWAKLPLWFFKGEKKNKGGQILRRRKNELAAIFKSA
jgi:hypothetical protein